MWLINLLLGTALISLMAVLKLLTSLKEFSLYLPLISKSISQTFFNNCLLFRRNNGFTSKRKSHERYFNNCYCWIDGSIAIVFHNSIKIFPHMHRCWFFCWKAIDRYKVICFTRLVAQKQNLRSKSHRESLLVLLPSILIWYRLHLQEVTHKNTPKVYPRR